MDLEVEDDVDGRLIRVEVEIGHIRVHVAETKSDIKDIRGELSRLWQAIADLRVEIVKTRVWTLGLIGANMALMAHGFHWI